MGFGSLGIWEIVIIGLIVLVFFGPNRLPEIARSTGRALREFRRGMNEIQRELEGSARSSRPSTGAGGPARRESAAPARPAADGAPQRGAAAGRPGSEAGEARADDPRVPTEEAGAPGAAPLDQPDLFERGDSGPG